MIHSVRKFGPSGTSSQTYACSCFVQLTLLLLACPMSTGEFYDLEMFVCL